MDDSRRGLTWHVVSGAMELSWFMACAMFYSQLLMHRPFPFVETVTAFAIACLATHLTMGRGWRVIVVLTVGLIANLCGALIVLHGIYYGSYQLFDSGWLFMFYNASRTPVEWLILVFNIVLTLALLAGGITLAHRPRTYQSACNRFDLGLAAFFALFLIKLIASGKGEALAENTLSLPFIYPFFLSGLLSIGMSRNWGDADKTFLSGHRTTGIILGFTASALAAGGMLLLFFLPFLTSAARLGQQALAAASKPLLPVLVTILRFVFGPHGNSPAAATVKSPVHSDIAPLAIHPQGWWTVFIEKVMVWGIWGLLIAALAIATAFSLYYAVKWLFSKTAKNSRGLRRTSQRATLRALLRNLLRRIQNGWRGYQNAAGLYGALVKWASRSGLPHQRSETPTEFGARLATIFPSLLPSISIIIDTYNREAYGEQTLKKTHLGGAASAWRRLQNPRLWPMRLKSRLITTREQ